MSNYLNNLIAVALHPGGDVHPRVLGRFEAPPVSASEPDEPIALARFSEIGVTAPDNHMRNELAEQSIADVSADDAASTPFAAPSTETQAHKPEPAPVQQAVVHDTVASADQLATSTSVADELTFTNPALSRETAEMSQPATKLSAAKVRNQLTDATDLTTATDTDPFSSMPAAVSRAHANENNQPRPSLSSELDSPFLSTDAQPAPVRPLSGRPRQRESEPLLAGTMHERSDPIDLRHDVDPESQHADIVESKAEPLPDHWVQPILGQTNELVNGRTRHRLDIIESSMRESSQPAKPELAPTVHVTIGRIEIKTATPPQPQQLSRPQRQQPTLPLDQYLQRRNEGRR